MTTVQEDRDFRRADAMMRNLLPHENIAGSVSAELSRRLNLQQCPHCHHHYEILKSEVRCYGDKGSPVFCGCPCPNGRWSQDG